MSAPDKQPSQNGARKRADGPDDTTPPSAADDTTIMRRYPAHEPCPSCGHAWCRCDVDDDEPERTWPVIGSAT